MRRGKHVRSEKEIALGRQLREAELELGLHVDREPVDGRGLQKVGHERIGHTTKIGYEFGIGANTR